MVSLPVFTNNPNASESTTYLQKGRRNTQEMDSSANNADDGEGNGILGRVLEQAEPRSLEDVDLVRHERYRDGVVASSRLIDRRHGRVAHVKVLVAHIRVRGAVDDLEAVSVYGRQVGRDVHRE